jgi:hypothetical protein
MNSLLDTNVVSEWTHPDGYLYPERVSGCAVLIRAMAQTGAGCGRFAAISALFRRACARLGLRFEPAFSAGSNAIS